MLRRLALLFALLLIFSVCALVAGGAWFYRDLQVWANRPLEIVTDIEFNLPRGSGLGGLADELEKQGLIDSALRFQIWVRLYSDYSKFQAGRYRMSGLVSPASIAAKIQQGDIYVPVALQFTIPEGFTVREIFDRLAKLEVAARSEFDVLAHDQSLLTELRVPEGVLEGFLYPATYTFSMFPDAKNCIKKMVATFWEHLPEDYEDSASAHGINLLQAVTIASLIERETPNPEEMPLVSEVIWNRLKAGMPLGIDAALIYGIPNYSGNLTRIHLNDATNLYNTRIHKGLPPTPIGSPGLKALEAVFTPSSAGYYYYVLDLEQGSRHHFSKNMREHSEWVKKLVRDGRTRHHSPDPQNTGTPAN